MKYLKILLITVSVILLILDQYSSINITSATFFKLKKYNTYKELRDTIQYESYEIVQLSKKTYAAIHYSEQGNFFLINDRYYLSKINSKGQLTDKMLLNPDSLIYVEEYHYVLSDSTLYDFSKEKIIPEKTQYISFNSNTTEKEREEEFKKMYSSAKTVIYTSYKFRIYLKIDNNWFCMSQDWLRKNFLDNYPPKAERLIYLKDTKKNKFSDWLTSSPLELFNNSVDNDQTRKYVTKYSIKNEFFNKNGNTDAFAWTNINATLFGTAYYKIKLNEDTLTFKAAANKNIFSFGKVNTNLYYFVLPQSLSNQSEIRFIQHKPLRATNNNQEGIFIIRPISN